MTDDAFDPEERQRRFDRLMDSLSDGSLDPEDLTGSDLGLLRDLYGEREHDLEDLLDGLRRLAAEED